MLLAMPRKHRLFTKHQLLRLQIKPSQQWNQNTSIRNSRQQSEMLFKRDYFPRSRSEHRLRFHCVYEQTINLTNAPVIILSSSIFSRLHFLLFRCSAGPLTKYPTVSGSWIMSASSLKNLRHLWRAVERRGRGLPAVSAKIYGGCLVFIIYNC